TSSPRSWRRTSAWHVWAESASNGGADGAPAILMSRRPWAQRPRGPRKAQSAPPRFGRAAFLMPRRFLQLADVDHRIPEQAHLFDFDLDDVPGLEVLGRGAGGGHAARR